MKPTRLARLPLASHVRHKTLAGAPSGARDEAARHVSSKKCCRLLFLDRSYDYYALKQLPVSYSEYLSPK